MSDQNNLLRDYIPDECISNNRVLLSGIGSFHETSLNGFSNYYLLPFGNDNVADKRNLSGNITINKKLSRNSSSRPIVNIKSSKSVNNKNIYYKNNLTTDINNKFYCEQRAQSSSIDHGSKAIRETKRQPYDTDPDQDDITETYSTAGRPNMYHISGCNF